LIISKFFKSHYRESNTILAKDKRVRESRVMYQISFQTSSIIIKMDKFNQQLIDILMRARNVSSQRESKAASLQQQSEMVTICKKEYEALKDHKCANVIK
jgi:energy-converting hydrogenase A subunit M